MRIPIATGSIPPGYNPGEFATTITTNPDRTYQIIRKNFIADDIVVNGNFIDLPSAGIASWQVQVTIRNIDFDHIFGVGDLIRVIPNERTSARWEPYIEEFAIIKSVPSSSVFVVEIIPKKENLIDLDGVSPGQLTISGGASGTIRYISTRATYRIDAAFLTATSIAVGDFITTNEGVGEVVVIDSVNQLMAVSFGMRTRELPIGDATTGQGLSNITSTKYIITLDADPSPSFSVGDLVTIKGAGDGINELVEVVEVNRGSGLTNLVVELKDRITTTTEDGMPVFDNTASISAGDNGIVSARHRKLATIEASFTQYDTQGQIIPRTSDLEAGVVMESLDSISLFTRKVPQNSTNLEIQVG